MKVPLKLFVVYLVDFATTVEQMSITQPIIKGSGYGNPLFSHYVMKWKLLLLQILNFFPLMLQYCYIRVGRMLYFRQVLFVYTYLIICNIEKELLYFQCLRFALLKKFLVRFLCLKQVAVNEAMLGSIEEVLECVRNTDILKPTKEAAWELLALLQGNHSLGTK